MPQSCLKDDIFTPHQYGPTMTGHTYGFSHPCSLVSLAVTLSGIIPASSEIPCCASKNLLNIISNSNNSFQKAPGLTTYPNAVLGGSQVVELWIQLVNVAQRPIPGKTGMGPGHSH